MATLESLIFGGDRPIDEYTDEELEQWTMTGRIARENEAEAARGKRSRSSSGTKQKTVKVVEVEIDLTDDF